MSEASKVGLKTLPCGTLPPTIIALELCPVVTYIIPYYIISFLTIY